MYWDRVNGVNNIIVHPDPYNFLDYMSSHAYYKVCAEKHKIEWENKEPLAYFRGALNGIFYDKDGN